jgi:hypothetical protein
MKAKRLPRTQTHPRLWLSADLNSCYSHRRAVISVLLSHVIGWRSLVPRMVILNILAHVQDATKETALLPLLKELVSRDTQEERWARELSIVDQRQLATHILDCLTARVAKAMSRGQATDTFNLVLTVIKKETEAETGECDFSLRRALALTILSSRHIGKRFTTSDIVKGCRDVMAYLVFGSTDSDSADTAEWNGVLQRSVYRINGPYSRANHLNCRTTPLSPRRSSRRYPWKLRVSWKSLNISAMD